MRLAPLALASIASALLSAGCSKLPAATAANSGKQQPTVADIAKSFKSYKKLNDRPVFVNPDLSMLCRGRSPAELIAAQMKTGPHLNAAISIYMNESAAQTFSERRESYEPGAVIVKEKWKTKSRAVPIAREDNDGVGGMVKRAPGFDPEHGDWEYFYFENPAKIEAGAIASCVKCHEGAKKTDYVFGSWASHAGFTQRASP